MITLTEIVDALRAQLDDIEGLHVTDYVPGSANLPAAFILPPDIDYRQTYVRGYIRLELEVAVLVSATVDRAQRDVFGYLDWSGTKSILAAVEADKTLGLTGINAVPMSSRPLAAEEVSNFQAWGAAVRFLIGSTTS